MKTFLQYIKEASIKSLERRLSKRTDLKQIGDIGFIYKSKKTGEWTFWYKDADKPSPYTYPTSETASSALKNAHQKAMNSGYTPGAQNFSDELLGAQGKIFNPVTGAWEVEVED